MANKIAPDAAIAKSPSVLGDGAKLTGDSGTAEASQPAAAVPTIEIRRGIPFVQRDKSWPIPDDGTPVVEFRGGRFEQYFRFKDGILQCAGLTQNSRDGVCLPAPTDDSNWHNVKGYPGVLTVTGADGKTSKYFTVENATSELWPCIRPKTYTGKMMLFKDRHAIFVDDPGKLIHRIVGPNGEDLTGYPSYVCGCIIPGDYDDSVKVDDVRSVKNPGAALDAIIAAVGGFATKSPFTVTIMQDSK